MNLAVLSQRFGDYDRARDLLGEALGLFATVKNSELQLAALYNMAHVERELGLWESAIKLYEATSPLAVRIGQSDIEIGAIAGAGICSLELGRTDDAQTAVQTLHRRMETRPDWFQGRELVEALAVRVAVIQGDTDGALHRLEGALTLAEGSDIYTAAWLAAACGDALSGQRSQQLRPFLERYAAKVDELGYSEMTKRYAELMSP
jgi:tetratricopeptide (TPR) repeat protein